MDNEMKNLLEMLEKMIEEIYKAAKSMGIPDEEMREYFVKSFQDFESLGVSKDFNSEEVLEFVLKVLEKLMNNSKSDDKIETSNKSNDSKEEMIENSDDFEGEIN
ncbi:hypothetical protein [Metamycoplasma equirhinis]|uniref:hypothetical protein n=1 Tax=Metamycoplasma equirhinis TaxID=92402 RepID=UPI0035933EA6